MRASLYLIGFAAASIVGAGLVQTGCSSSSSTPASTPPTDASTPSDAPVVVEDAPSMMDAVTPCTPISDASVATIMTGSSSWNCLEAMCGPSLTACAADCTCNNDVLTALACTAADGGVDTCFGPIISSSNPPDTAVLSCLSTNMAACGVAPADAGTDGSTTPEAGATPDAGDGG